MTDTEVGLLLIGVAVAFWFFKKKKPPQVFFVDVVEVWARTPKKRLPRSLVNMAIVAGIALFIWMMNH